MNLRVVCGIFLLVAMNTLQAQTSQPDGSIPTFHVTTQIATVPIVATRSDGSAVNDLHASDLRVFDNKKPQTIRSFELVTPLESNSATGATSQRIQLSTAEEYPHFTLILLDALNTSWSDQIYARRAVEHLLDHFPAGQRVAILVLSDKLYLLHDFSNNVTELRTSLRQFSFRQPYGGESSSDGGSFSAQSTRPNSPDLLDLAQASQARMNNEGTFFQRNRTLQTLQALTAIADLTKHVPGRKDLIWISAGFPLIIYGNRGEFNDSFYGQTEEATRALSTAGLRLYPVDARGLVPSPKAQINIDTMKEMAEGTGGKAFYNNNDLAGEVQRAIEDSRLGYLLTYAPNNFKEDGSFHQIRVRASRKGIDLRYRSGYYAELPPKPVSGKSE